MTIESVQQPDSSIQKLGRLIKGIEVAMLTTEDQEGCLHSRPMATLDREFDGSLWFLCREASPKAGDIQLHQKVNLTYASPERQRFVSIAGKAEIVRDQAIITQLWNPSYAMWFPEGTSDLVLIRVNVESAQYWELPHGPVTQMKGFLKAVKSGKYPQQKDSGENEKIQIA